eukprot:gene14076-18630_t
MADARAGARPQQASGAVTPRFLRIKARLRYLGRRFPRLAFLIRCFVIFSATFGGAYGFIAGSRSENSGYDPHAFAIGASFLFALACVALASLSMRMRFMSKRMRKLAAHNEALVDRNWELKEAEERARPRKRLLSKLPNPLSGFGRKRASAGKAQREVGRSDALAELFAPPDITPEPRQHLPNLSSR